MYIKLYVYTFSFFGFRNHKPKNLIQPHLSLLKVISKGSRASKLDTIDTSTQYRLSVCEDTCLILVDHGICKNFKVCMYVILLYNKSDLQG